MRRLLFTSVFIVFSLALKAQGTVTFQENFFNNNKFKIDGKEAKADEVAQLMEDFEETQKNFWEGHKQMRIGSGLRILSVVGIATGLIYGLNQSNNPNALETYLLISVPSAGLGLIGNGIRQRGKDRVETSVGEYNFLKEEQLIYFKQVSVQLKSGGLGMVYKF